MLERVGVISLGVFVAYLLGLGLANSKPTLRVVGTVLGAALGGVPVAFLANSTFKWLYPVGLLAGLLTTRMITLLNDQRHAVVAAPLAGRFSRLRDRRFLDRAGTVAALGVLLSIGLTLPDPRVVTDTGTVSIPAGALPGLRVRVRHNQFEQIPKLNTSELLPYPTQFHVENPTVDGFEIVLDDRYPPDHIGDPDRSRTSYEAGRIYWSVSGRIRTTN